MPKDFGFTGTQERLPSTQCKVIGEIFGLLDHLGYEWMHNGDCVGADDFAGRLWKTEFGGKIHLHPPDVQVKRAFLNRSIADCSWSPKTYRARNEDIVMCGHVLVAAPKGMEEELRSGTWMTVRMARRAGVGIIFAWPDGTITTENCPEEFMLLPVK